MLFLSSKSIYILENTNTRSHTIKCKDKTKIEKITIYTFKIVHLFTAIVLRKPLFLNAKEKKIDVLRTNWCYRHRWSSFISMQRIRYNCDEVKNTMDSSPCSKRRSMKGGSNTEMFRTDKCLLWIHRPIWIKSLNWALICLIVKLTRFETATTENRTKTIAPTIHETILFQLKKLLIQTNGGTVNEVFSLQRWCCYCCCSFAIEIHARMRTVEREKKNCGMPNKVHD